MCNGEGSLAGLLRPVTTSSIDIVDFHKGQAIHGLMYAWRRQQTTSVDPTCAQIVHLALILTTARRPQPVPRIDIASDPHVARREFCHGLETALTNYERVRACTSLSPRDLIVVQALHSAHQLQTQLGRASANEEGHSSRVKILHSQAEQGILCLKSQVGALPTSRSSTCSPVSSIGPLVR